MKTDFFSEKKYINAYLVCTFLFLLVGLFQSWNVAFSILNLCLKDLVTFNRKHNFANREQNRDGDNHNNSWNHGTEGPTTNLLINDLRKRQQKNLILSLFISKGVPMILMGDEIGRSQGGNNYSW